MNYFVLQVTSPSNLERILETLLDQGTHLGLAILKALIIFIVGRYIIKFINKLVKKILHNRDVAPAVWTFVGSLVNITLTVMLLMAVIGALGIQTTSFAALIASAGVAIGMALSGNLSNFAGGIIILLFKPFKIGDNISTANVAGTVEEIQIFHTVLTTGDNLKVFVPNSSLSSGYINNFNVERRRIEWVFGVDYGVDFEKVKDTILKALKEESRILPEIEPFIELKELDASSVNIIVRVWVIASDYWDVYFNINKIIYRTFNEEKINFPYPQITVHKADTD